MIYYCNNCNEYTFSQICTKCKSKTVTKKPPKFSFAKDYSKERLKSKGLM